VKTQADVVTFSLSFHCDFCLACMEKSKGTFHFSCGQPGWRILISGDWRSHCIMRAVFVIHFLFFSSPFSLYFILIFLKPVPLSSPAFIATSTLCIDHAVVLFYNNNSF